jgi:hypothetical protein
MRVSFERALKIQDMLLTPLLFFQASAKIGHTISSTSTESAISTTVSVGGAVAVAISASRVRNRVQS